jgi:hypothetical protein
MRSTVVLTLLLASALSTSGYTVNELFDDAIVRQLINQSIDNPLLKKVKTIDIECVKQKVNFAENGNKSTDKMTLTAAVFPSFAICSGDAVGLAQLLVDFTVGSLSFGKYIGRGDCFKLALLQIEPDSPILTGFDSKHVNFTAEECDRVVDQKGFDRMIAGFEDNVGSIDKFTCGVIKKEELFGFSLKFPTIANGKLDPKIEKEAKKSLAVNMAGRAEKLLECMVAAISKGDIENEV